MLIKHPSSTPTIVDAEKRSATLRRPVGSLRHCRRRPLACYGPPQNATTQTAWITQNLLSTFTKG